MHLYNEIKKALYKENPLATLCKVTKAGILYNTTLQYGMDIYFIVPLPDIDEGTFSNVMFAKHLIRWMVPVEEVNNGEDTGNILPHNEAKGGVAAGGNHPPGKTPVT